MSGSKMYCSAPQCSSRERRNANVHYHTFPPPGREHRVWVEDNLGNKVLMDRLNAWKLKLKITRPISKYMRICSLHFTDHDYFYRDPKNGKRKNLKKNAVPSKNLPDDSGTKKKSIKKDDKSERKEDTKKTNLDDENGTPAVMMLDSEDIGAAYSLLELLQSQVDEGS